MVTMPPSAGLLFQPRYLQMEAAALIVDDVTPQAEKQTHDGDDEGEDQTQENGDENFQGPPAFIRFRVFTLHGFTGATQGP